MRTTDDLAGAPQLFLVERPHKQSRSRHSAHGPECRDRLYLWGRGIRKSRGEPTMHCRRAPSTPTLLVKIFGRARVGFSTASGAVVMGEVGCVPLGRWQHTRTRRTSVGRCAIEREARMVFRICNAFEHGRNATDLTPALTDSASQSLGADIVDDKAAQREHAREVCQRRPAPCQPSPPSPEE